MDVVAKYLDYLKHLTIVDKLCIISVFVLATLFLFLMEFYEIVPEKQIELHDLELVSSYHSYVVLFLLFCFYLGFCFSMVLGSNITTKKVFFLPVKAFGVATLVYVMTVLIRESISFSLVFSWVGYTVLFVYPIGFMSFFAIVLGKKMYDVLNWVVVERRVG